jgi:hypothetical protein
MANTPEQIAYDNELARIQAMPPGVAKNKARDAFDTKYPNGRPTSVGTGTTETGTGVAEALAFGLTEALIKAFPELKPIYDLFVAKKFAEARLAYYETNYYKNLTSISADRKKKQATQRGVYDQEFDAWKQEIKRKLIQKGYPWSSSIEGLLEASYLAGDSDYQLETKILNSGLMGKNIGGSTLGTVNSLRIYAAEQGINNILPSSYWEKVSMGILSGELTDEGITEELKGFAVSAYPAYAKGILEGRSFNLQTSAARQSIANLLEKDVDTITNDNPLFQKATGYINPDTGAFEIMPLWKVQQLVKNSDEWLYTNNARDSFDNVGRNILKQWGLAF